MRTNRSSRSRLPPRVLAAAALWIVAYLAVLWLADGRIPFDRPAVAQFSFFMQLAAPSITLIEIFVLMALTFLVTRQRAIPDMSARAPDRPLAIRETTGVLVYAALAQVGG